MPNNNRGENGPRSPVKRASPPVYRPSRPAELPDSSGTHQKGYQKSGAPLLLPLRKVVVGPHTAQPTVSWRFFLPLDRRGNAPTSQAPVFRASIQPARMQRNLQAVPSNVTLKMRPSGLQPRLPSQAEPTLMRMVLKPSKIVQRTKYDVDVREIDTADHEDFATYAEAMRRVNPARLEDVRKKILTNAISKRDAEDLWATIFLNKLFGNLPEWLDYPPIDHSRTDANLPATPYVRCGNVFKGAQPGGPMHRTKRFVKWMCKVGNWPDVYCWWPTSISGGPKPNKVGFIPQCEYGTSGGGLLNTRAKSMYPEDAKAYPHLYE